jgi:hypothetical protein
MAKVKSRSSKGDQRIGMYKPALHLSFYEGLITATSRDVALTCGRSDSELERDIEEIRNRLKNEGISFLTRTLPLLGKSLDKALATDTALEVTGFKLRKASKLPCFMHDVFKQVFGSDGRERSDASPQAVKAIRQISYLFYKLNLPPTEEQKDETIQLFLETDEKVVNSVNDLSITHDSDQILKSAQTLVWRVLADIDPFRSKLFWPKHGPGAVATGEKAWEKPRFKRYYQRLADQFPYDQWFFFNTTHLCDQLSQFLSLPELDAGTAKVVLVPKDSRGPRLISCEPLEYQWIQQGLMRVLVKTIEQHKLTRGLVNFTDQTVNQRLALDGSVNGTYATLDMKEASDRVGLALVKALFPPLWFDALFACRSDSTRLPDGQVVYLKKFAPMGSAVCFPVEALIFWALSTAAIMWHKHKYGAHFLGSQLRDWKHFRSMGVYVYGDDIIVHSEDHAIVRQYLPLFGLQFNEAKCCTGGFFRESCGVDAYKGIIVTPLRLRPVWSSRLIGTEYLSYVAFHNAAEARGFYNLCDYLQDHIQSIRRTPYVPGDSPGEVIGLVDSRKNAIDENKRLHFRTRLSLDGPKDPRRPSTQCYEIYSWMARTRTKCASLPGWDEMQRVASLLGSSVRKDPNWRIEAAKHLSANPAPCVATYDLPLPIPWEKWVEDDTHVTAYHYPVPRRVTLKRGWARYPI